MKELVLTEKDKAILAIISNNVGSISPTEIGMKCGKCYTQASSYCSASLKRLMEAGLIIKITTNKVRYKLKQFK